MRSALRASGASAVLIPSSVLAAVATAAAVESDVDDDDDGGGGGDVRTNNNRRNKNSSVLLLGLAAAVADEGLSALPWPRSAFDDARASAALQLAAGGWESRAAAEKAKYLALGAAGSLSPPPPLFCRFFFLESSL